MDKKQLLLFHIIFWLLYILGIIVSPILYGDPEEPILELTFFIITYICFYLNYFLIVPKFYSLNRIYKPFIGYIISVSVFVLLRYLSEQIILPVFLGFSNYNQNTPFSLFFFDNIYFSSSTIFISTVFSLFKIMLKSEKERLQLITEKKQAELQALKTQINPHFIFNSLNNIYSLVYQKSDKSLFALEKLSEILRYSTKDLEQEFIPLEREVGYIDSLIELEKLRIKNPKLISIVKEIENPKIKISPMLLVPFIENVFKHADLRQKGFDLIIIEKNNLLTFKLKNSIFLRKQKDKTSGIGIKNIKKRLDLIYPKKYSLIIKKDSEKYSVDLSIIL